MNEWNPRRFGPLGAFGSDAPALVLVHGAGDRALGFRSFAERLSVPVAAVDLPGRGESADLPPCTSIAEMAEAVESALTALARPVVLLGHSMGGAVVIEIALRKRLPLASRGAPPLPGGAAGLRGIILYSTGAKLRVSPVFIDRLENHYGERSRDTVRPLFGPAVSDATLDAFLAIPPPSTNVTPLADFRATNRFDRMADVASIDLPTLVIGGDSDAMTPAKYQAYLADQIRGSERVILPGVGHMGHWESPSEVTRAVESFTAKLTP